MQYQLLGYNIGWFMGYHDERVRYDNYVWLEAVSAIPNTEYLKTEYIVKQIKAIYTTQTDVNKRCETAGS